MANAEPSAALMAAYKHIEARCSDKNAAFYRCKQRDQNPASCVREGDAVTHCVLDLYVVSLLALETIKERERMVRLNASLISFCLAIQDERDAATLRG